MVPKFLEQSIQSVDIIPIGFQCTGKKDMNVVTFCLVFQKMAGFLTSYLAKSMMRFLIFSMSDALVQ